MQAIEQPSDQLNQQLQQLRLRFSDYQLICQRLHRIPNEVELAVFAAMWSEHCSYRSSKQLLAQLPKTGKQVVAGPGENAGVVDIGNGWGIAFKIESHNHPSMIEPYHGAATGVGGILRDVFSLGARPIACGNSLHFGTLDRTRMRTLVTEVVRGIGGYGNSFGVATVVGDCEFHSGYNENILVNAAAFGLVRLDRLLRAQAPGVNCECWYVGARTGKDGVHGATMASQALTATGQQQRPTIQVGDPFAGKKLMEAVTAANTAGLITAAQDMGAAGLISASVEMAAKAGIGIQIDLDKVPLRDQSLLASEILLSESQERMLLFIDQARADQLINLFGRYDLEVVAIGTTIAENSYRVWHRNEKVVDLALSVITDPPSTAVLPQFDPPDDDEAVVNSIPTAHPNTTILDNLQLLLQQPNLTSRAWVWQQFDRLIQGRTRASSETGGAAIIAVPEAGTWLGLAIQSSSRHCQADPRIGAAWVAAKAWLDLIALGAEPLAFSDNLNYGNPETAAGYHQLAAGIKGLAEAGRALQCPYVSGNVSLYNESDQSEIPPTPVVVAVGQIHTAPDLKPLAGNERLLLLGTTAKNLNASRFQQTMLQSHKLSLTPIDWSQLNALRSVLGQAWHKQQINFARPVGSGGALVGLAKLALAHQLAIKLTTPAAIANEQKTAFWFGENCLGIIVATNQPETIITTCTSHNVPCLDLGIITCSGEVAATGMQKEFALDNESISCNQLDTVFTNNLAELLR